MSGQDQFYTLENPVWYVLTIILSGLIAIIVSNFQKKGESVTEAKRVFLEQRIQAHSKLFIIYSKSKIVINLKHDTNYVYHQIYKSYDTMSNWYDELLIYSAENQAFLSKNVNKQINIQNSLRKHLDYLYKVSIKSDENLIVFATKYYKDLDDILEILGKSIAQFFETELSLNYKFGSLDQKDLEATQKYLYKFSVIKDHFKSPGTIV
jgi:hypothetical protein